MNFTVFYIFESFMLVSVELIIFVYGIFILLICVSFTNNNIFELKKILEDFKIWKILFLIFKVKKVHVYKNNYIYISWTGALTIIGN